MQKQLNEKIIISNEKDSIEKQIVLSLANDVKVIDYQEKMIQNNQFDFLIPLKIKRRNDKTSLIYDTTSTISAAEFIENNNIGRQEAVLMLKNIIKAVNGSINYMFDERSFIIHEDYIFINPENLNIYLLYVPIRLNMDFNQNLKAFTRKLINCFSNAGRMQDTFIDKISDYIESNDFNLIGFKSVLEGIQKLKGFDRKASICLNSDEDFKISIPKVKFTEKQYNLFNKFNSITQTKVTCKNQEVDDRNVILTFICALQILIIISIVLILQFVGNYDLTTIFGILLIAVSADVSITKFYLNKKKTSLIKILNINRNEGIK
ncbi:MAG: DUF6382 domain-containing protein [Ignavibacteriales bacterium]